MLNKSGICTSCGAHSDNLTWANDIDHVCPTCLDAFWQYCDRCGCYFDPGSVEFFDCGEEYICEYCFEDEEEDEDE